MRRSRSTKRLIDIDTLTGLGRENSAVIQSLTPPRLPSTMYRTPSPEIVGNFPAEKLMLDIEGVVHSDLDLEETLS